MESSVSPASTMTRYLVMRYFHTSGERTQEVTFADLEKSESKAKRGYKKIRFCGDQAKSDGLQYFWIDTCCIKKANKAEYSLAIRSVFRWYRNVTRCYV
jgi:hypothetical protein